LVERHQLGLRQRMGGPGGPAHLERPLTIEQRGAALPCALAGAGQVDGLQRPQAHFMTLASHDAPE